MERYRGAARDVTDFTQLQHLGGMVKNFNQTLRLLLPPLVFTIRDRLAEAEWEYVADEWPVGDCRAQGWDDPSVGQLLRENWHDYVCRVGGKEPLAFWPWTASARSQTAHNLLMTFGYILARSAHGRDRLSVLDWGGGLGYYALVARALMPELSLDYLVKEVPHLCVLGRELSPEISFTSSDDECFARGYDLVLANGSLQYVNDWKTVARRLIESAERWALITWLPFVRGRRSFVAVQRPYKHGFRADYLLWVFNRDEFLGEMERMGAALDREFLTPGWSHCRGVREEVEWCGFLLRPPTRDAGR